MRPIASTRMQVVTRELKEARLKDCIEKSLRLYESEGDSAAHPCLRLIARSPDSPVARAVGALVPDATHLGLEIRALFLDLTRVAPAPLSAAALLSPPVKVRRAGDWRLTLAHEQLVLASGRVWMGDSMRRDPTRRDAFESFLERGESAAGWAIRSFDRFWAAARAIDGRSAALAAAYPALGDDADTAFVAGAEPGAAIFPLLH